MSVDVDKMVAGRELDALIAERVFGIVPLWDEGLLYRRLPHTTPADVMPYFSSDIAAAWQVAVKLKLSIIPTGDGYLAGHFDVEQEYLDPYVGIIDGHFSQGYATAETAPLAVCRAALNAVADDRAGARIG